MRHLIYGQLLESTVPLELAPPAFEPLPMGLIGVCQIKSSTEAAINSSEVNWYHYHSTTDHSTPWLALGRFGAYHIFQFSDGPCFRLHESEAQIDVYRNQTDEPDPLKIELLLLNHVVPLVIAHRGHPVFHASAIAFPEGAALFIGESGTGKSTLARHLAGSGLRLLTDDCAALKLDEDPPLVFSGYPAIRVIDDSLDTPYRFRGKAFLSPHEFSFPFRAEPAPIAAVFQLQPKAAGAIEIEPLSERDAQLALTRHAFRLDPGDRDRLRNEFKMHADLAKRLPVFKLCYPHDKNILQELGELLRSHLENLGATGSGIPPSPKNHHVRSA